MTQSEWLARVERIFGSAGVYDAEISFSSEQTTGAACWSINASVIDYEGNPRLHRGPVFGEEAWEKAPLNEGDPFMLVVLREWCRHIVKTHDDLFLASAKGEDADPERIIHANLYLGIIKKSQAWRLANYRCELSGEMVFVYTILCRKKDHARKRVVVQIKRRDFDILVDKDSPQKEFETAKGRLIGKIRKAAGI